MKRPFPAFVLALTHVGSGCGGTSPPQLEAYHCGTDVTPIHDIQGAQASSPLLGQPVTVEGVVVGDFRGNDSLGGFFLQAMPSEFDTDPKTSEGLFVYQKNSAVEVALGDWVTVTGTVKEYQGLTELADVTQIRICQQGVAITSKEVSLPAPPDVEWESLEGMRVKFPQVLYVADTSVLGHYGEITLSSAPRLQQPTEVVSPGAGAQSLLLENERSKLMLDDGSTLTYPESIPFLNAEGTLRLGDGVQGLTGVLSYAFGQYVLYPASGEPPKFTSENPRPSAPAPQAFTLRVVSFNLDNYFTTLNTGSPKCGPSGDLDCRGANSASEFARQREKILATLSRLAPDIAGLVELENNEDESIRDLVDGLNGIFGEGAYAFIDTGTLGTDAIKVGLIYKPRVALPLGDHAVLDSAVDPGFLDTLNRPVLAQTFVQLSNGAALTVVVNHLKSKGSGCPGDPDRGDGQGPCNLARLSAVRSEIGWLAADPTRSGDSNVLILGDFNAYTKEDPMTLLSMSGYANLTERFDGPTSYSYVFDGQFGTLDHVFASSTLASQSVGAGAWHINADEPNVLDYNEEHNPLSLYHPGPFRSSDHDPTVVELQLGGQPVTTEGCALRRTSPAVALRTRL
jgi:uncharacterized protein